MRDKKFTTINNINKVFLKKICLKKKRENIFVKSAKLTREYISTHEQFTFEGLANFIYNQKGVLRAAPDYTIKEYLVDFEEKGKLLYIPLNKTYYNLEILLEKALHQDFSPIPPEHREYLLQILKTKYEKKNNS